MMSKEWTNDKTGKSRDRIFRWEAKTRCDERLRYGEDHGLFFSYCRSRALPSFDATPSGAGSTPCLCINQPAIPAPKNWDGTRDWWWLARRNWLGLDRDDKAGTTSITC